MKPGQISYVSFLLPRKANLEVRTVLQSDEAVTVKDCAMKITCPLAPAPVDTQAGVAAFRLVSPGTYRIKAAFADPMQDAFDGGKLDEDVKLEPGETRVIPILLLPRPKLKVKLVLESDHAVVVEDCPVKITRSDPAIDKDPGRQDRGRRRKAWWTSAASRPRKMQGSCRSSPNPQPGSASSSSRPKGVNVELKHGDDTTLLLEVAPPLYKKVAFVAHCLPTIAKQIWHDGTKTWTAKYNGLATENAGHREAGGSC